VTASIVWARGAEWFCNGEIPTTFTRFGLAAPDHYASRFDWRHPRGVECAARQIGIGAGHSIVLGQVNFTGQFFKEMRPLQAVHDRTLDLGQVERDPAINSSCDQK